MHLSSLWTCFFIVFWMSFFTEIAPSIIEEYATHVSSTQNIPPPKSLHVWQALVVSSSLTNPKTSFHSYFCKFPHLSRPQNYQSALEVASSIRSRYGSKCPTWALICLWSGLVLGKDCNLWEHAGDCRWDICKCKHTCASFLEHDQKSQFHVFKSRAGRSHN